MTLDEPKGDAGDQEPDGAGVAAEESVMGSSLHNLAGSLRRQAKPEVAGWGRHPEPDEFWFRGVIRQGSVPVWWCRHKHESTLWPPFNYNRVREDGCPISARACAERARRDPEYRKQEAQP